MKENEENDKEEEGDHKAEDYEDSKNHLPRAMEAHGLKPRELRKIPKWVGPEKQLMSKNTYCASRQHRFSSQHPCQVLHYCLPALWGP